MIETSFAPRCSDAAWSEARALIDLYVEDPEARYAIRRAIIEYGKQEAFMAIDCMTAQLRKPARKAKQEA